MLSTKMETRTVSSISVLEAMAEGISSIAPSAYKSFANPEEFPERGLGPGH